MLLQKPLIALAMFFVFTSLYARDVEIIVEDTELELPLEGAVIRLADGSQYVCDSDGKAVVSVPDDRQITVQAAYPGYESGRVVITAADSSFTVGLRLSGIMESRELVIEESRPGTSETKTGRSVAISGRDIAQTAEIGIIEDVMSSIKLLPGVGYTGLFNAQPSIRGGDPGDMNASFDGFYIMNPYHWGGGFSIFDPGMVESAQLSHGVFSGRYGNTISGLLDITSKKPSPTETEIALGASTSAANFSLSFPFSGKGGIMAMGKITYYDPVIWLAQLLAKKVERMRHVNSISTAPYIRSVALTGNYRFTDTLDFRATGFFGVDGVGVHFNPQETGGPAANLRADFEYTNYQAFFTAGLSWNPRNDMLLKFTAGTGFEDSVIEGDMSNSLADKTFEKTPANEDYFDMLSGLSSVFPASYSISTNTIIEQSDSAFNVQGRLDYDWEIGSGFLAAAGVQEMFTTYKSEGEQQVEGEKMLSEFSEAEQDTLLTEMGIDPDIIPDALKRIIIVRNKSTYSPDARNRVLSTAGYALGEYKTPDNRFGAELGLRVDHFLLFGNGFTLQSQPALNPRLNIDVNIFRNIGILESFDIGAGTGLFSSVNKNAFIAEERYNIREMRPNRSWTSVLGLNFEFPEGLNLNVEGYFKHVFDRMYIPIQYNLNDIAVDPQFDGIGRVWGIDVMIQKLQSRYWDGWISYSFSWAKYKDPSAGDSDAGISGGMWGDDWYYPSYHRFHNLNLVLNIKPSPRFNIYTRFGLASGVQRSKRVGDKPLSYPVFDTGQGKFIEKYYWPSVTDEYNRTTPSLPLDIKFSIFGKGKTGKSRYEIYVAVENVLALVYTAQGNTTFDSYTGEVYEGGMSASYDIPVPVPSVGFKYSY